MNDTHDSSHRKGKPYFLWTKFKEDNPQYLFGGIGERIPNGHWSSLDFAHKEVRDRCIQFFKEICDNYDIDGVELDFLRHFELFKTVAKYVIATDDGLYIFKVDSTSLEAGINKLSIEKEGKSEENQLLKDAAIFFCRDKDDVEMRELIALCINK